MIQALREVIAYLPGWLRFAAVLCIAVVTASIAGAFTL